MMMKNKLRKRSRGKDLSKQVMEIFLVEGAEDFKFIKIKEILTSVPADLKPAGLAFVSNLSGMVSTICMPVTIALASAQQWRYKQILIAERIRGADRAEAKTRAIAEKRFKDEMDSKKGIDIISDTACDFLLHLHHNSAVKEAASELLLQGIVLAWGAVEILARDVFEATVNARPLLGKQLLDSPDGRKLYQIKAIDLETLAKHDFNISGKMGSILVQFQDLSKLSVMRTTFESLYPSNTKLRNILRSKHLWILNQRRHLIVHNRSVADQRYIDNTGDIISVSQKLRITPKYIEECISLVQSVGVDIINTARTSIETKNIGT